MTLFVAHPHTPFRALVKVRQSCFFSAARTLIEGEGVGRRRVVVAGNCNGPAYAIADGQLRGVVRSFYRDHLFLF